jgi:hypothetical protein
MPPIISDGAAYDRPHMDANTFLAIAVATTIVLWAATWVRQPDTRRLALRGAAIALGVALVLTVSVFVLAMVFLNATPAVGLIAGGTIGLTYLLLNLVVLAIGLWFKPSDSWSVGSALATPVIVAAIGFGYAAYRAWPLQ